MQINSRPQLSFAAGKNSKSARIKEVIKGALEQKGIKPVFNIDQFTIRGRNNVQISVKDGNTGKILVVNSSKKGQRRILEILKTTGRTISSAYDNLFSVYGRKRVGVGLTASKFIAEIPKTL